MRAPTVLFASERGQGRAAFFAARRSKPLTLRSGEYAGEWLCAQQFRAHNHDDKALIPPSQVGQVYERKAGQFLRASRAAVTIEKVRNILSFLQAMTDADELRTIPSWRAHQLTGDRKGTWSLTVTKNWRLTFRIDETDGEIVDLDYEDYH